MDMKRFSELHNVRFLLLTFAMLCLVPVISLARPVTDSLFSKYLSTESDSVRYDLLYRFMSRFTDIESGKVPGELMTALLDRTIRELRASDDTRRYGLFVGLKAEATIAAGQLDRGDQYCDTALRISEKLQDYAQLGFLYWMKMLVYQKMNLRDRMVQALYKAIENNRKVGNTRREAELLFILAGIYSDTGQRDLAKKTYLQSAELTKDSIKAGMAFLFIGEIEQKKGNLAQAGEYIMKGRSVMNCSDPGIKFFYYFILGKWLKATNNNSKALESFETAFPLSVKGEKPFQQALVCCEIAGIFLDENKPKDALNYLEKARGISEREQSQDLKIEVHQGLSRYYELVHQHSKALEEYKTWRALKDSLHHDELSRTLTRTEKESEYNKIENQRTQAQRILDEQQAQKMRRQKLLAYSSAIILLFVGSIAFLFYRNNRQQKRANIIIAAEKQRSEDLLHNILPEEVASELKETGSTRAKDFRSVTVLFTDFKNFTSVSERLSAQQLVNEINFLYSEFDRIITGYGLEKIKTIGDSYMCAGGLPVESVTHPEDAVSAALDIRDFILKEKQKRIEANLPFFDIRIGLHSGPVVAGIVGTKKFAYDIWGDTVNIASRMESSGEPGKVNISNDTRELVKDRFDCLYRGKIEAKNKGMIDMYFVEHKNQVISPVA
jgi:adenylate cyclase